ncbi:MAG: hypothetical protein ACJ79J_13965 [Gemmatimonadaceae bacterium]
MKAVDALLAGLVDYAGLFPPAGEDMRTALENYAAYAKGPDRPALGRFIVPVTRLEELEKAADDLLPSGGMDEPWRLSVLVADDVGGAVEQMTRFNREHSSRSGHRAIIDVVEMKASTPEQVVQQRDKVPAEFTPYFEIPLSGDLGSFIADIAKAGGRAKVRTGGVTPDAFPAAEKLADFIVACAHERVPFKATAGLHHPLHGDYRLTYEPDSANGSMYGFVNVFLASVMAYGGEGADACVAVLEETDRSAFAFEDDAIRWRGKSVTTAQIAKARSKFAIAFGSCSFREPVDELAALTRT